MSLFPLIMSVHEADESRQSRQIIQSLPDLNAAVSQLEHWCLTI